MKKPAPAVVTYSHSRRKHVHRCLCCNKLAQDGSQVLMWWLKGVTRIVHMDCADKVFFDGPQTYRQLAEAQSEAYARELGYAA